MEAKRKTAQERRLACQSDQEQSDYAARFPTKLLDIRRSSFKEYPRITTLKPNGGSWEQTILRRIYKEKEHDHPVVSGTTILKQGTLTQKEEKACSIPAPTRSPSVELASGSSGQNMFCVSFAVWKYLDDLQPGKTPAGTKEKKEKETSSFAQKHGRPGRPGTQ